MPVLSIKKVHVQKRTLSQWLTLYLIIMPFFINAITFVAEELSVLKYTLDVAYVGITVLAVLQPRVRIRKSIFPMLCIVILFLVFTFITYGFRFQSAAYFLWGFRNNFRYYFAFFAVLTYATQEDLIKIIDFLDVLFWINVVIALYQYFVLGYSQDYLGGLFGTGRGCNAGLLVFFCVILSKSILLMLTQRKKTWICILQIATASFVAALAELKVFFLILTMIVVLSMALTKFSWKKCLLAIFLIVCLFYGSLMLTSVFGKSHILSVENIMRLVFSKNYSTQRDLGRLNAIPVLSRTILHSPLDQLIGLGLGNCDTSAFAICNTPFFQSHSKLNYTWFSSAFLFLETGYIGLLFYLSFFVVCFIEAFKKMKKTEGNVLFCQMAIIMAVLCVVLTVYNSSLRSDIGYIAYFALALPFVRSEQKIVAITDSKNLSYHLGG